MSTSDDIEVTVPELDLAAYRREVSDIYRDVRISAEPEAAHRRWRERRDRLFSGHSQSPLASHDPLRNSGLPYWPYDPSWRFALELHPAVEDRRYAIGTGADEVTHIRLVGFIQLPDPIDARLAVWWLEQYGGGLFVPFKDGTAGTSTYGAGRYLLDTAKGADLGTDRQGRLILDFNFSYHPSCRYDAAWQCPLAPPESTFAADVTAGERLQG